MATRAIYTFRDDCDAFHVYKHWDGYPSMAVKFIEKALTKAWELPHFDPRDFGAAFIAANKDAGGDVYLSYGNDGLCDYKYEISYMKESLHIVCFHNENFDENWVQVFEGSIDQFKDWIKTNEQTSTLAIAIGAT